MKQPNEDKLPPISPGDVVIDWLDTYFGKSFDGIINGTVKVDEPTAIRLSRLFGPSAAFWLNLQAQYDKEVGGK